MNQNPNINKEEEHNEETCGDCCHGGDCKSCIFLGEGSDSTSNEDWEAEFREYFDKTLKPKKPTMGNLDRELCIDFIHQEKAKSYEEGKEDMKSLLTNYGYGDSVRDSEARHEQNKHLLD
jgi:hypothetical protein